MIINRKMLLSLRHTQHQLKYISICLGLPFLLFIFVFVFVCFVLSCFSALSVESFVLPSSQAKGTKSTLFLTRTERSGLITLGIRNEVNLIPLACKDFVLHATDIVSIQTVLFQNIKISINLVQHISNEKRAGNTQSCL